MAALKSQQRHASNQNGFQLFCVIERSNRVIRVCPLSPSLIRVFLYFLDIIFDETTEKRKGNYEMKFIGESKHEIKKYMAVPCV